MTLLKVFSKTSIKFLIAHKLTHAEFRCQCDYASCKNTLIAISLITAWDRSRAEYGKPLKINSGFRCQVHNSSEQVQGVDGSKHTLGMAIDISTRDMGEVEIETLRKILFENFDYVRVYPTFIHAQVNE